MDGFKLEDAGSQCTKVLMQLINAVEFSHNNNIVWRDIKHDNILVMKKFKSFDIILCDFGMCGYTN